MTVERANKTLTRSHRLKFARGPLTLGVVLNRGSQFVAAISVLMLFGTQFAELARRTR